MISSVPLPPAFLGDALPGIIGFGLFLLFVSLFALMPVVVGRLSQPDKKGQVGEWLVSSKLRNGLPKAEYQVLDNLLLPDGKGGQTQVDHVVISIYGVFVIETKNWDCWVFGGENGRDWTLTYKSGRKVKSLNPLQQNKTHVAAVLALLGIKPEHCHNIVALLNGAVLKTGPIPGVIQNDLVGHLRAFREPVLNPDWLPVAVETLQAASKSDDKLAVAAHLDQVQAKRGWQTA